jgi:hypothetical protein
VSRRVNIELAIEEAIEGARKGLAEDWEPELAVVFLSSAYVQEYGSLVVTLRSKLPSLKYIAGSTVSSNPYYSKSDLPHAGITASQQHACHDHNSSLLLSQLAAV